MVPGFTGGGWAYALNSNDPAGVKTDAPEVGQQIVKKGDEMLAYYYLGWPSVEVRLSHVMTRSVTTDYTHFILGS